MSKRVSALVNATSNDEDYVFISYSHNDQEVVGKDLEHLAKHGVVFWYDEGLHGGENWVQTVEKIVLDSHCKGIIFYISESFLQSESILKEIKLLYKKKELVPNFRFISVLIGMDNVFSKLLTLDLEEEDFLLLANTFRSEYIYFKKEYKKFTHAEKLLETLKKLGVIKKRFRYDSYENLKYENYTFKGKAGIRIVDYDGMETNLIIPAYINGEPVISIGDEAFSNNNNLESVILSEGLLEIADRSFKNCQNLSFVNLPTSLIQLGYETFRDCKSLKVIIIPSETQYIGDYCFYRCHELETVMINSDEKVIFGFACFSECIKLKKISLPERIAEIGSYCFNKCELMESIELPEETDYVGIDIFFNCTSLKYVDINTKHSLNNSQLFKFCHNLTSIILTKENYDFFIQDAKWIEYRNLFSIQLAVPYDICIKEDYSGIVWKSENEKCKYRITIKSNELVELETSNCFIDFDFKKNTLYTIRIQAINEINSALSSEFSEPYIFEYGAESFTLSEDNKKLLKFKYCNEKKIVIPDNVEEIGDNAFYQQQDIEEVYFGKNIKKVGVNAFFKCNNLTKVVFNEGLEEIAYHAFGFCVNLQKIVYPSTLKTIEQEAFICCNKIKTIDYSKCKINEIRQKTYYRCVTLKNVIWNEQMKDIKSGAFRGCIEYDFSKLPTNLESIGSFAFSFNMLGNKMNIPEKVVKIEEGFLYYATIVEKVNVHLQNKEFYSLDGVVFNHHHELVYFPVCHKNRRYIFPKTCISLSDNSLVECEFLEYTNLKNVKEIKNNCINWCRGLKTIVLGKELTSIGDKCFNNCQILQDIYILNKEVVKIGKDCFKDTNPNVKVYVDKDLIHLYKKRKNWRNCKFEPLPSEYANK